MPRSRGKRSVKAKTVLPEDKASTSLVNENSNVDSREPSAPDTLDKPSQTPLCVSAQGESSSGSSHRSPGTLPPQQQFPQNSAINNEDETIFNGVTSPDGANTRVTRKSRTKRGVSFRETESHLPPNRARGGRVKGVRGRRGRDRGRATLNFTDLGEASLFEVVTNNSASLGEIVDQWIGKYKGNKEDATLMLLQFFVDSTGAKFTLTSEMQAMEHDALIHVMTEEDTEDKPDYPLIATGSWKKFRFIYSEFLMTLICQCRNSIIYDRFLMDKLISLLTELSDSNIRAYRHTATFATMKLMSALVEVALPVSTNLSNIERQYEVERRKSRQNRATDRLESLVARRTELQENMAEIKEMLNYTMTSVFRRRYADVVNDIRAVCIAEIGLWMLKFHEYFLDDCYLKYIGWTLWDDAGEVRLKCLEVLQPLFASESFAPKLDLFTRKFKDRIVVMARDKEFDVGVQAVKLVTSMLKYHREILTEDDCEKVYILVYSAHRDLAHAAGELLNEKIFTADEDAVIGVKTKSGKQRLPNTPAIRDLVLFFIESNAPEHAIFLVDSLIETNEMMKDWECMIDLLLEEAGPGEETLDNQSETCLIEIMVCCIKQAATGESPIGREPARKNLSAKMQKQLQNDKRKLTEHFIPKLFLLLDKYQADREKILNLLAVPQYFDLEMYTSMRQERNLNVLLESMNDIVEKVHDADVWETAAKSLECMCAEELGIFQRCNTVRSVILGDIVNKYKEANDKYTDLINASQTPDDDEMFSIVQSLLKLSIFYSMHDMNSYKIWDSLWKRLEDARFPSRALPDEVVTYSIRACYFSNLWSQINLIKNENSKIEIANETRQLTERLHSFMDLMVYFVGGDANASALPSPLVIREEAYNSICDFLIFFNITMLKQPNPVLHQLAYMPDNNMKAMLNRFVQENVFSEEPDDDLDDKLKIAELHKRRNFLAGYCKLVMYTTLPASSAVHVFKNYVKHHDNYGDIIKSTIGKVRDLNRMNCAGALLRSLSISYDEMVAENGEVLRDSEAFTAIKTLAKKFALLFGFDAVKNSAALLVLHGEGFTFATKPPAGVENDPSIPPKNLPFLEILAEFSHKLTNKDRAEVLHFVEEKFPEGLPTQSDEWNPLLVYRNSLIHGTIDQVSGRSKRSQASRKKDDTAGADEIENTDPESIHKPVAKPKKKKRPGKAKLAVSKMTHPRGPETSGLEESDPALISVSPMPAIEDSSQNVYQSNEDRLRSLQIHSPTHSSQGLFKDLTE